MGFRNHKMNCPNILGHSPGWWAFGPTEGFGLTSSCSGVNTSATAAILAGPCRLLEVQAIEPILGRSLEDGSRQYAAEELLTFTNIHLWWHAMCHIRCIR